MENRKNKSYSDLEIYSLSYDMAIKVHEMTLKLPKYEMFEEGSQVRKSSKGIPSFIVEDYGRKKYIEYTKSVYKNCKGSSDSLI